MVQIINRPQSQANQKLMSQDLGSALQGFLQMQQENQAIKQQFDIDLSGIHDPKQRQQVLVSQLQGKNQQSLQNQKFQDKEALLGQKQSYLDKVLGSQQSSQGDEQQLGSQQQQSLQNQKFQGKQSLLGQKQSYLDQVLGRQNQQSSQGDEQQLGSPQPQEMGGFNPLKIPDEAIIRATAIDPAMGKALRDAKDTSLQEKDRKEKDLNKKFESERKYHSSYSKDAEQEADQFRSALPKKEMALNFARNAVESGDLNYFSPDKLADITGSDLFRTAKGAQLVTAGKENLLTNISRVSSRGQNLWFEQRLNSMFPKIGQSNEANLTVQEMLEGELALDQAYLNEFDRLSAEDEKNHGFVSKDIKKRTQTALKPLEKDIFKRTNYRMKEIEEQEKGLSNLKKNVGKNVIKGTPMTLAMAKLYKDKFGENALKVAEKNGYYIPTLEEFQKFQQRPQEFREELSP